MGRGSVHLSNSSPWFCVGPRPFGVSAPDPILLLTPLRSGFVPLAPVGPPNSVRVSQACHRHVRHKWRFCAEEAQEYETLNEGGNGLLVTPRDDVHALGITRLKTRIRSSYLNNPKNPT